MAIYSIFVHNNRHEIDSWWRTSWSRRRRSDHTSPGGHEGELSAPTFQHVLKFHRALVQLKFCDFPLTILFLSANSSIPFIRL
jgi:hypothetical protein